MTRLSCIVALALAVGCGAAGSADSIGAPLRSAADLVAHAELLSIRGAHGAAAAYYESALDAGGEEGVILPRLVASLVRAGELRRALGPLARLRSLRPEIESCADLEEIIRIALGQSGGAVDAQVYR